jgi:hypothetical protein
MLGHGTPTTIVPTCTYTAGAQGVIHMVQGSRGAHLDDVVCLAFGLPTVCVRAVHPAGQHLKLGMQHIDLGLAVTQLQGDPACMVPTLSRIIMAALVSS